MSSMAIPTSLCGKGYYKRSHAWMARPASSATTPSGALRRGHRMGTRISLARMGSTHHFLFACIDSGTM